MNANNAIASIVPDGDGSRLAEAFAAFNAHSDQLNAAYARLQAQAGELADALRRARDGRHRASAEKTRLAARMAQILEALPALVLIVNADDVIVDANAQAADAFGIPLIGSRWADVAATALAGAGPGEFRLRQRWLALTESRLDEAARLVVLIDVTAAHAARDDAERQQRLEMLGEMAARLAHQIRTPLSTAMLWAARAGDDAVGARIVARLRDIESMVDDMLRFARGTPAGGQTIDVRRLAAAVVADARETAPAGLTLEVTGPEPGPSLRGNAAALGGAIANLVANAVQHSPADGRVTVAVAADPDAIEIGVSDQGGGVGATLTDQIFEPFFTTRPEGTGLGLAVVRSVAQAHGGDVGVESLPRGSRFTIRLPIPDNDYPPVGGTAQFSAISAPVPSATSLSPEHGNV